MAARHVSAFVSSRGEGKPHPGKLFLQMCSLLDPRAESSLAKAKSFLRASALPAEFYVDLQEHAPAKLVALLELVHACGFRRARVTKACDVFRMFDQRSAWISDEHLPASTSTLVLPIGIQVVTGSS